MRVGSETDSGTPTVAAIISRIARLQHPGVLRDFRWPGNLPAFGRFNLIYGWNGSGKTTLSRFFRHLEQRTVPSPGQVSLAISGQTIRGADFPNQDTPIRVFNRDYVDESVFPSGGGDVPPIFVLGADSVKKQKQLQSLRTQQTGIDSKLEKARTREAQATRYLDSFCRDQAKLIKEALQIQGGAFNYFNKSHYLKRVAEVRGEDLDKFRLSDDARSQLLRQHQSTHKPKLPAAHSLDVASVRQHTETVMRLLQETVVSSSVSALREDPELGAWVREGLRLHKGRSSVECLMCEQPLPNARLEELEGHFNAAYERLFERIDCARAAVLKARDQLHGLRWPDGTAMYEDLVGDYREACSTLETRRDELCEHLEALAESLQRKREAPFTKLAFAASIPAGEHEESDRLNEIINLHNLRTDEFETRTTRARERIADGMMVARLDEVLAMEREVAEAAAAIQANQTKADRVKEQIGELEREILEHRRPADELNDDLERYLGHRELTIGVRDTGYAVMRGGSLATSLSDGERTALALLYFLKTLGDRRFEAERGVVVLDDPVSSLDANAMYLALGYIRDRAQTAGQLFVLTHNFSFFRQVRNWFHHLPGQNSRDMDRRPARFYMLREVTPAEARRTTVSRLDPLLEEYESEYHYLFSLIYREARRVSTKSLESSYYLPNVARRLLEAFLAFRLPHISGDLWKKLQSTKLEGPRRIRVLRFVHTHSHGDSVDDPEHDPTILGEAKSVLADLLELIEVEDPEHYRAMVEVVNARE